MAKLPKVLYVRSVKDGNGKDYFIAGDDINELDIAVGDKDKVGVYTLTSTLEARGIIQTAEVSSE
jgi:hypothetical protein